MDRSLHGEEQQEDDSATRHEEDSVVSGHTIHSFQLSPKLIAPMPRQALVSAPMSRQLPPVSRQPTPVIMGDRLTGDRLTSASSASRLPAVESSPPQTRPQLPMSPVDHTAVRLTAGGRLTVGDREDEIEAEISSSMSAWAGSLTTLAAPADAPERQAVDSHTIRRPTGQFDQDQFDALNDSRTNLPRLPAPTRAAAPAGAAVSAPAAAAAPAAGAPVAAPAATLAAAPAGVSLISSEHVVEPGVSRATSEEGERRPSIHSINHEEFQTYQEEQQAVAAFKMHEVARGEVSFLDKLGRVRRGQAFRWRNPKHEENVLDTFGRGALGRSILKGMVPARPAAGGGEAGGEADAAPKPYEADPRTEWLRAAAPAKGSHEEAANRYESYQFDEPESKLHFEERVDDSGKTAKTLQLLVCTTVIILSIGGCIGLTSAFIAIVEGHIFSRRYSLVMSLLWPCCEPVPEHADEVWWLHGSASMDCSGCLATHAANASSTAADVAVAAVAFVGFGAGLMLLAALLCVWAPSAALSGLPQVKAYLNGTRVPMLLRASTLVAKAIGITLVVSTAMPLGKEGPMVHIGSIIGSGLSRVTLPFMREMIELRSPKAQRLWVGMGAAAGVAAAFNAPVGGILYSFEEVCCGWG